MTRADRLSCEEVFQRLDDYLDRELSPPEVREVRAHLDACTICAAEFRFEGRVLQELRDKVRRIAAPAGLLARVTLALGREAARNDGAARDGNR